MNKIIQTRNDVSLCYKDSCIHAKGSSANLIANGVFVMLLLIGISALLKAN